MVRQPSYYVLILANLIPVAGVLLFDWSVPSILVLYWTESVAIGVINVLRMICCRADKILPVLPQLAGNALPEEVNAAMAEGTPQVSGKGLKFFLVPFFIVHYGGFCFGHLSIMLAFFSVGPRLSGAAFSMLDLWQPSFWVAVVAIFCSHLYSFFTNYIGNGEYKRAILPLLMFRPYGRIIVMQLAIIFGAGFTMFFGSPLPMLLILIGVKIFIDLRLHMKERVKFSVAQLLEA
jgi:hypothetical protein